MNKEKLRKVFVLILLVAAGGSAGYFATTLGMKSAKTISTPELIILLLFIIPAFFIVIAIHEGGHALAGSWVKFNFRMYVVGPFMWDKEDTGWKFKWNKNVNLFGGLVVCLPTSTEGMTSRFAVYASGGPLASLIFAGAAYGLGELVTIANDHQGFTVHLPESMLGTLALLSFSIFLVTAMPLHSGGFYSDGARVLRFLRGGEISRFEVLIIKIFTSSSGGVRPRLLDLDELNEAMALAKKINAPMRVYLLAYLYQIAFDKGQLDEAEQYLKEYISEMEHIPKGVQNGVWLDAAFFYAVGRKDLKQAEYYWKKFEPSAILPKAHILATEAAISFLQMDIATMNRKIEAAMKELPNMIDRGVSIALQEKLIEMKEQIQQVRIKEPITDLNFDHPQESQ